MKVLFVEARKKLQASFLESIAKEINSRLVGKLHMVYTIQYKHLAEKLRKILRKRVVAFQQVIGCSKIKPKAALLLIGSGRFHALQLAFNLEKEIFFFNGTGLEKISMYEIETEKKKEKARLSIFLVEKKIGIIFSTKSGQNRIREAEKIKNQLEKRFFGKGFYLFISDTLNQNELGNFPLTSWINTACPGIETESKKIINIKKINQLIS